ncbi:MAG: hypothetical protein JST96_17800, partial [Bacteroidetes bacterium]|nr:hypothetical protein [Bacteroidota bacterium]
VPVCKSQFKNISADKFYISPNPSFSLEARLGLPKQLYLQGKYEEARREYILLEKEYPDNQALRNEHIEFERNIEFNKLVKEGDIFFYKERKYRAAQMKYREALTVRDDESVRDKIADCENHILGEPQQDKNQQEYQRQKQQQKYEAPKPVPIPPHPIPSPFEKNRAQIIAGIIGIVVFGSIYLILHHKTYHIQDSDGSYYKYTGDTKTIKIGDEKKEIPDGEGEAEFDDNGATYKGGWRDGKFNGKGLFTWKSGEIYDGYFKNGYREGDAKYTYKEGILEGTWRAGTLQGSIHADFNNGNKYDGNWMNNTENGYGTFTWKNGDKYVGYWLNGERHGQGTQTWADGNSYSGEFKYGYRDGIGTLTWNSGDIYHCPQGTRKYYGGWKRDLKQGRGTCYDINGTIIYEGNFDNDKPISTTYFNNQ